MAHNKPLQESAVGLLALDGVRGPGFWGATGPPNAVKMRSLLILVPEEASLSELPHRQKSCGSEHLSLALTSTPDDLEAGSTS